MICDDNIFWRANHSFFYVGNIIFGRMTPPNPDYGIDSDANGHTKVWADAIGSGTQNKNATANEREFHRNHAGV